MIDNFDNVDATALAAILYQPEDDADRLLANFVQDLARHDVRVGGIVQRHVRNENGTHVMLAVDVATGREISISQLLGSGAASCKLDTNGLAEAALVVSQALRDKVDLLVISKFAKQEAVGRGLRAEFVDAITRGVPLLTAVPRKCLADWRAFTGDVGMLLPCDRQALEEWWCDVATRPARCRAFNPSWSYLGTMIPDSLMTAARIMPRSAPESPVALLRGLRKQP
ncbi:DUF2478 domain-containing protein [Bradyrhizobium brasilense]|uniref:DUF2478 domain-containing protein n=1 Tax=Bradyrhizobium brasilense TaxID=1419277 RepID=UPI001457363D|nr:DUF2478 domain-containing protein [Bradyrhizobium brasilense]NLS67677.1 DUF2478 domain-containing protein [Bradyrhizobium brasilense]